MIQQILLIEDDAEIGELLCEYLAQYQLVVTHELTATSGLTALYNSGNSFSAVILDVMLPDNNGFDVCKKIRQTPSNQANIPIIMLTAKGDAMDRIIGMEIGADDYIAKPFEPRELVARIKAVLRRVESNPKPSEPTAQHVFGNLRIDTHTRTVFVADQQCMFTGYQFDILTALASRAGKTTSREQLMNMLKQQNHDIFDRSIDVHISRIRAMIETDTKNPKRIVTMRGVGYFFANQQD